MNIDVCPITGTKESFKFIDLGKVPLVNNLCNTREESLNCRKYELSVQLFTKSRLACITEWVDKEKLFLNYVYQSGVNKPFIGHCMEMYEYLLDNLYDGYPFIQGQLIIDIGGNDGTLLKEFKRLNPYPEYINIDASRSFIDMNEQAGIRYINKFFDEHFQLDGSQGADLILSTNVFQHNYDIRSFVRGVKRTLNKHGVWCLEFPYLLTTMFYDNYDQIYHEHVYYYLLKNIIDLLDQEGMKIINVSFHDIHSGTLRVLSVLKDNPRVPDHSINSFLEMEKTLSDEAYKLWGERTIMKIVRFREFIQDLYFDGAKIACFGAAAKGCVFLNSCGLDDSKILFIIDDTPFKQGKFVPGTGLKIVGRDILKTIEVDYLIILAHNFKDFIINSLKDQYKGKFIIMFPDIKVI
jgi:2-polyprenyl-3-methyl-5-hydroxy-6-metoxy-1,4-benzoquinol methylase